MEYTSIVSGAALDRICGDAVSGYWIKRQGKLREAAEGSVEKWNAMFDEFELSPTGLHLYKESYLESGTRVEAPPTVDETLESASKLSITPSLSPSRSGIVTIAFDISSNWSRNSWSLGESGCCGG